MPVKEGVSMKKLNLVLATLLLSTFAGTGLQTFAKDHEDHKDHGSNHEATIDKSKSKLNWTGKKVTGQHEGTLVLKSGKVVFNDKKELTGGEFVIDMKSIKVTDIKVAKDNKKLTNHLKSPDFFDVKNHSSAKFVVTSVKKSGDDKYDVTGDLTIKGKTHPVSFPVAVQVSDKTATARGTIKVDRTKYDVRYGSGKFFDNLGDKMIYDDFEVALDLKAKM